MKHNYLILLLGITCSLNAMKKHDHEFVNQLCDIIQEEFNIEPSIKFHCGIGCCGFTANTKKELLKHKRSHCQLNLMKCACCNFRTKEREELFNHFRQAHGLSAQQSEIEYQKVQGQLLQAFRLNYKKLFETHDQNKLAVNILIQIYVILEPKTQKSIIAALQKDSFGIAFYRFFLEDYKYTNEDIKKIQELAAQLKKKVHY